MKERVLFVCIHNSARSQMAETFLRHYGRDRFDVSSAGIEPGKINPIVVAAMAEIGFDLSTATTTGVDELIAAGEAFDYVITVCDETSAERCPAFPGQAKRLHWGFPDPSALQGDDIAVLGETRRIREQIRERVQAWCLEQGAGSNA